MVTRDIKNKILPVIAVDTQLIESATTVAGNVIDLDGRESVAIVLVAGTVTAGDVKLLIQSSPDDVTYNDVYDVVLIGTEADTLLTASNTVATIGYKGNDRYIKVSLVTTGGTVDLTAGALAVFGAGNIPLV